ncbi:MAG TPA: NADH-ubiquinone oxidoreductase-F iron-sulfur binding region domain-containing protein [Nitrospira sp.]|nr:NADH-ubiquinone oxidoreductase-F iron-sulfur binding region domain-containing protein [Nitrospira sp.]
MAARTFDRPDAATAHDRMITIYLSNDTSARAAGADRLADAWSAAHDIRLVRTSTRGAFFLEPLVERDGPNGRLLWPRATPEDLPRIRNGVGGIEVAAVPFLAEQTRVVFAHFGEGEPLSLDQYRRHGGWRGLERAAALSPEAVIEDMKTSGLRGRGGAAFPVWQKWDIARRTAADRKYVVANADEGDAGTYCDRMIMEGEPFRLIEGMLICAKAIGADHGYTYCRWEYPAAAATMSAAIAETERVGLLNIDGRPVRLEVFRGAGSYVCGEETALLSSLEGGRGMVKVRPPYPAVAGLYGQPTVVSNVLTFGTATEILARGGAWHASLGTDRSKGTIALQLGGRIAQPGLVEIPFGATVREVLERFGGGMAEGARLKAVQVGGPLGSLFPESQLDMPLCFDAFNEAGAVLGHGGLVVFDDQTDMVDLARHYMTFTADESCGKCTPCRIGSVRARELLERIESGRGTTDDMALLSDLGETMKATSLCAHGGRAPFPVLTAIEHFPGEFTKRLGAPEHER